MDTEMTDQEFEDLLAPGHEHQGFEFKGPGPRTDTYLLAKVARAVLGMANRRDGGLVVIGVEDNKGSMKPVGLSLEDLATWKYDDLSTSMGNYADPSVSLDVEIKEHNGRAFIVIHVQEFEVIPVLCKQDYFKDKEVVLRKGACYVRSRHKPETSEIPSQVDMRELLDLAIDKGIRKFVTRAFRSGLTSIGPAPPNDKELFDAQVEDLQ